jgi:hypothetical protein
MDFSDVKSFSVGDKRVLKIEIGEKQVWGERYSVTFFDSDIFGGDVLSNLTCTYGIDNSDVGTGFVSPHEGYVFEGWQGLPEIISSDVTCQATYSEQN